MPESRRARLLEGTAVGVVIGPVAVWIGIAGIFLVFATAGLLATTRQLWRLNGALLGIGLGMTGLIAVAAARCPAAVGIADSCTGTDLRPALLAAAASAVTGVSMSLYALLRRA